MKLEDIAAAERVAYEAGWRDAKANRRHFYLQPTIDDVRLQSPPILDPLPSPPLDERIFLARLEGKWEIGQVVEWGGKPHRVGQCSDGNLQCLACERLGYHVEPISTKEPTT